MIYKVQNIFKKASKTPVTVTVPGSKSITARALLLATLARGKSTLCNAQFSDDCAAFFDCIKNLGIACSADGTTISVEGCGGILPVKSAKINVRSAGTAARFLTALLAFSEGEFYVDSSDQMKRRPIKPLIDALKSAGVEVESKADCFPLTIRGTSNPADSITVDVTASSQFLSALLISAVCAKKPIKIIPVGSHGLGYVKMTLDMMWSFGVNVEEGEGCYKVFGDYSAKRYEIEPDMSAAAYFYAMNRILGTDIRVNGVQPHSMQGDAKFISVLKDFDGGRLDMSEFSDQALTLAAIAPYFSRPTEICGVAHIRRQECDRIRAICENLRAMGIACEERADGVKIFPGAPRPATINTYGDHRVAMSFAVTGLRADGIRIADAEVCSKTFSEYFTVLDGLIAKLT